MFAHGLVVGKFAPFHKGHQHLVETALSRCVRLTVLVYATPDFANMPNEMRAGWVRTLYPSAAVCIPRNAPPDASDDQTHQLFVKEWLETQGLEIDAVFTSELYGPGFAETVSAEHVMVDHLRQVVQVRGRDLRHDRSPLMEWLDPVVWRDISRLRDLDRRVAER